MKKFFALFLVVAGLIIAGCGKKETTPATPPTDTPADTPADDAK
jgi:hypothetical protein